MLIFKRGRVGICPRPYSGRLQGVPLRRQRSIYPICLFDSCDLLSVNCVGICYASSMSKFAIFYFKFQWNTIRKRNIF